MEKELDEHDEAIDLSMKVAVGIAGTGFMSGSTAVTVSVFFQANLIKVSLLAISVGFVKVLSGKFDAGIRIIRTVGKLLQTTIKGEALGG